MPRSIGGLISTAAICPDLFIEFNLLPLDCESFLHEYGRESSELQMTIDIWKLPATNGNDIKAIIPFYTTRGDGFLLLGNEIVLKSHQLWPESFVRISTGVRNISDQDLHVQTYFEPTSAFDPETGRTYFLAVSSKTSPFNCFLCTFTSLVSDRADQFEELPYDDLSAAGKLACKQH